MTSITTNIDLSERDRQISIHPLTNLAIHRKTGPVMLEHGKGIHVWDSNGKRYIEGLAGLWCTALGHGEEEIADVASEQLRKLAYSPLYYGKGHPSAVLLADKLIEMAPFKAARVLFGTSGSDANDTQIKMMWYYNNILGKPQRKKIISRRQAYHGSSIASASLTGLPIFQQYFDLPLSHIIHTDCPHYYRFAEPGETEEEFSTRLANNLEQLIQQEDPETIAAFIAEPLMGAGGVIVPPRTYFEKIQAVLKKYNIMFIDDEVICGFGRTGNVFGAETYGIHPDTMSLAKALTSAYLPLSAVIIPEAIYEALEQGCDQTGVFGHGYTYTGHPVSTAVALKTLELYEERGVYAHAREMGQLFQSRLHKLGELEFVGETRGTGLIGALEFVKDKTEKTPFADTEGVGRYCAERCQEHGLIVRQIGDTIALCPPLIVTPDDIDEIFEILEKAVTETIVRANKQPK